MIIDPGWATIIAAAVISIPGIVAAVISVLSWRDVHKIKKQTNSLVHALVEGAHREGVTEGKKIEKNANEAMG